jgi:hypothetical protein
MRKLAVAVVSFILSLNAIAEASMMYPDVLQPGSTVDTDTAIVLVGNGGRETIDYLQFTHSSMPAINARGIVLPPGGVVAVPVPVGTKALSLNCYTVAGRPGGYFTTGMGYGYIAVHSPPVDIGVRGTYYVATIFPGTQQKFELKPTASMLAKFRAAHRPLASLKPVNFNWPR